MVKKVRHHHNLCSTCQLPIRARLEVDRLLQEKPRSKTIAEIAKLSGISKSSLSRHFLGCLLGKKKRVGSDKSFVAAARRMIVCWPDGRNTASMLHIATHREAEHLRRIGQDRFDIPREQIRDDDLVIRVVYDDELPPPPPPDASVTQFLEEMAAKDGESAVPEPKPAA